MSRTDKTRPWWVVLMQDPNSRYENHDHRKGICDLGDDARKGWWCAYHTKLRYSQAYPPSSTVMQIYRSKFHRGERTRLRAATRKMIKTHEYDDFQSFHHRHSALWDAL